jgi:hypothetical protein
MIIILLLILLLLFIILFISGFLKAATSGSDNKRRARARFILSQLTKDQFEALRQIYKAYKEKSPGKANMIVEGYPQEVIRHLQERFAFENRAPEYNSGSMGKSFYMDFENRLRRSGYSDSVSEIIPGVIMDNYSDVLDSMNPEETQSFIPKKANMMSLQERNRRMMEAGKRMVQEANKHEDQSIERRASKLSRDEIERRKLVAIKSLGRKDENMIGKDEPILILGAVLDPDNQPILYRRAKINKIGLARQLESVANKFHQGDIRAAILALESDLEHG